MKVHFGLVPAVPSSYSNDELLAHVQHHFPDLSGSLLTLLQRFETLASQFNAVLETEEGTSKVTCPNCGTKITIDLELE